MNLRVYVLGLSSILLALLSIDVAAQAAKPVCALDSDYSITCSTPVPDCSLPANVTNPACQGMEEVLPGYVGASCTANDVRVVLIGLGVLADACINPTDSAEVLLQAQLTSGAANRYDVSWFIPLTAGGTGRNGLSQTGYLYPVASTAAYTQDGGPYRDSDTTFCGDIRQADGTHNFYYPFPVRLPCQNVSSGFLSIPRCVAWSNQVGNQSGNSCADVFQTGTNNAFNSKCNCATDTATDIPGPNVRLACPATPIDGNPLIPGQPFTQTFTLSNNVAGDLAVCSADATVEERLRCGSTGYIRVVLSYDATRGLMTNFSENTGGEIVNVVDGANSRVVWTVRNPSGTQLGAIGPNPAIAPAMTYTFVLDLQPGTGPFPNMAFNTAIYYSNELPVDTSDLSTATEQVCADCSCSTNVATTPVTLSFFGSERTDEGARVRWSTSTEVGNLGFHIEGYGENGWTRLTNELIPAKEGDSLEAVDYEIELALDDSVEQLALIDVDVFGANRRHRGVALGQSEGQELPEVAIDWSSIVRDEQIRAQHREAARSQAGANPDRGASFGSIANASRTVPIELLVTESGVHRVRHEDLVERGFDLSNVKPSAFDLHSGGQRVPIRMVSGEVFGPGSYFEFIAEPLNTLYTQTNVYRLSIASVAPPRIAQANSRRLSIAPSEVAVHEEVFERNLRYSFLSTTGDPWADTRMSTGTQARSFSFPFELSRLAAGTGELRVVMFGGINPPSDIDHHVRIFVNDVLLGSALGSAFETMDVRFPVESGILAEGSNTLVLQLMGDQGFQSDVVFLDRFVVSYPRELQAEGGRSGFDSSDWRIAVKGFSDANVIAYRTSPVLEFLSSTEVLPSASGYIARIPGIGAPASYVVTAESATIRPEIRAGRSTASIGAGQVDYLVISHPSFMSAIQPLVDARRAEGLTVRVVDVEDVYGGYSFGIFGPEGIAAYIKHAVENMGTRYVLLVGGDSYDYHDYLGLGSLSFIPSPYVSTGPIVNYAPADSAYADFDRDGRPEVALGRLPVRTPAELDALVNKTLSYQSNRSRRTAVFAADNTDPGSNAPFRAISERYLQMMWPSWEVERAYLDQYPVGLAKQTVVDNVNTGVALTSYIGHSGPSSWSFQGLLSLADVQGLQNVGKPTVVTQWGCWTSYYVNPAAQSMATAWLLSGENGAAAVLGATTLTRDTVENRLGERLMPLLVQPGLRIGDSVVRAKSDLADQFGVLPDVHMGWNLLGDPALIIEPL